MYVENHFSQPKACNDQEINRYALHEAYEKKKDNFQYFWNV